MIKKILTIATITVISGGLIWGAINRTQAKSETGEAGRGRYGQTSAAAEEAAYHTTGGRGNGYGAQNNGGGQGRLAGGYSDHSGPGNPTGSYPLTDAEKDALLYMVEEEKLAGDVYLKMYEMWGLPIFQNIAQSEQQHQQAVANLLQAYGITNPASNQTGVFVNPDLQALYDQLIAQGSQSQAEALRVGALIEELDIFDLQQRLAQTANPEVQQVFNNLMNGSIHHLSSFTVQYQRESGAAYQPQYLSADQLAQLLGTGTYGQAGNANGGSRGYRGGRN